MIKQLLDELKYGLLDDNGKEKKNMYMFIHINLNQAEKKIPGINRGKKNNNIQSYLNAHNLLELKSFAFHPKHFIVCSFLTHKTDNHTCTCCFGQERNGVNNNT